MSTDQKTDTERKQSRSKLFMIMGVVSLALMGLLWSLDDSLVYVTLGSGVYFIFLSFWTNTSEERTFLNFQRASASRDHKNYQRRSRPAGNHAGVNTAYNDKSKQKLAATVIVFVFFGVFFMIFFAILFIDDAVADETSLYEMAEQFQNNSQYDSARFYYRKAVKRNEQKAEALFGYGNSFFFENNYDSAVYYYDLAIVENNEYSDVRYNKALVRFNQLKYDLARMEARSLLRIDPEYLDAMLLMGDCFYSQNNYDSAIFYYQGGYNKGQRSAALCHVMAYIYDSKNQRDKAIALYQESIAYDSSKVDIYIRLSELLPQEADTYRQLADRFKSSDNQSQ